MLFPASLLQIKLSLDAVSTPCRNVVVFVVADQRHLVTDTVEFYGNQTHFETASAVLANWTEEVHTHSDFASVVAIEVLNEPVQGDESKRAPSKPRAL